MARVTDGARLAVLIDADNASAKHLEQLLEETTKYGRATVRRAYGDWTSTRLSAWKTMLLQHSVQPVQQFSYTSGKNATDSALIIDAMDLLYAGNLDGFCLVSSDSDFTRLAARIREDGLPVYGFGKKGTPDPFVRACTIFIYVENLLSAPAATPAPSAPPPFTPNKKLDALLTKAVELGMGDDGWCHLGAVGSNLSKLTSDFDSRTYGYSKLKDLMVAHPDYQITTRSPGEGKPGDTYVKRRSAKRLPTTARA